MPLYLKLNTRGLRLVLSTLLQSTNQSNYINEEDDKKAQKTSIEPTLSVPCTRRDAGTFIFWRGRGVARIGIGLTSDMIG